MSQVLIYLPLHSLTRKCPIRLKPACAANSRPVQFSQKRPNRLKLAHTPAKAGLDWYAQIFFSLQNISSFGDLVL
jgi:hypothetical protein